MKKPENCSRCGGLGPLRKSMHLERYLCPDCHKEDQDSKKKFAPITNLGEARSLYGVTQSNQRTIWQMPDYDVLYSEFESDCVSFKEIGIRYGTTRERIRQVYRRYFSSHIPRRPDGLIRRIICARKTRIIKREEKQKNMALNNPVISVLKSTVESLGLEVRIISLNGIGGRIISIAGRRCGIYSCRRLFRPSSKSDNRYWSFFLQSKHLKAPEFVILMAKDGERFKFFIVPTYRITHKFPEAKRITLYVPQKMTDPWCRTGRKSIVGIYQYENRWDFLGGPRFATKKAAPKIQVPPVLPSPA